MSKVIIVTFVLLALAGGGILFLSQSFKSGHASPVFVSTRAMRIESPAFGHNQFIPAQYTCDGEDVSPPLEIWEAPASAQSLVLIMDDPDAPGGRWLHWTVWNIPPATRKIAEASLPQGVSEGATDFGRPGYGGPCPPRAVREANEQGGEPQGYPTSGTHRYFFKLYALDTTLALPPGASLGDLKAAMARHVVVEAQLIGLYQRQR